MTSIEQLKKQLLSECENLPEDERLAHAGDMSVHLAEMLASLASSRGDKAAARTLLKAAMELETTVRHVRNIDDKYSISLTGHRLH